MPRPIVSVVVVIWCSLCIGRMPSLMMLWKNSLAVSADGYYRWRMPDVRSEARHNLDYEFVLL